MARYLFVSLNAIRIISLVALLLVFASNIIVMVHDIQAVNRFVNGQVADDLIASNFTSQSLLDSDYIPQSTVPNQPAGVFWAVLNRLLILFECIFLVLAECEFPISFFDYYFPVLGSKFGFGALGIFQCLIGAAVLSHHIGTFALVSAFLLFSVGCLNCLTGLIFRESGKSKRSMAAWRSPSPILPTSFSQVHPPNHQHTHTLSASSSFYSGQDEKSSASVTSAAPPYGAQAANAFGRRAQTTFDLKDTIIGRQVTRVEPPSDTPPADESKEEDEKESEEHEEASE